MGNSFKENSSQNWDSDYLQYIIKRRFIFLITQIRKRENNIFGGKHLGRMILNDQVCEKILLFFIYF